MVMPRSAPLWLDIVLGVGSLETTRGVLGSRLVREADDAVAWLDPADTSGLELGFVEEDPPSSAE
jgi:hypothetical protein